LEQIADVGAAAADDDDKYQFYSLKEVKGSSVPAFGLGGLFCSIAGAGNGAGGVVLVTERAVIRQQRTGGQ